MSVKILLLNLIILLFMIIQTLQSNVSYYDLLGVSKQATTQEIKQAYKKLAVKLHPDKNPNAEEQKRFIEIVEAYETLKDPQKRHRYDLYGNEQSYTRKYDYHSQAEYNNLYYNGLYHEDPFVKSLSGKSYYSYLDEGLYFINFYTPFCPPCQNLADHWKRLAEVYKGIISIGAVNCKYYNSFCYNTMWIGSYPTLLFYPNGKQGSYLHYRGPHTFEALEEFSIKFIRNKINVPTVTQIRSSENPMVYVLDNGLDEHMLLRIAYRLKGLATVVMATNIREKLSANIDSVIVFKYKNVHKEINSIDEKNILDGVVGMLPKVEEIGVERLKEIRQDLRSGDNKAWVIHFSKEDDADMLTLHQLKISLPELNFGEVDCDELPELCEALQAAEGRGWAVLKAGGGYQRLPSPVSAPSPLSAPSPRAIRRAALALALHTLSTSDFTRIINHADASIWVLLVVPYQVLWDHYVEPFTEASLELGDSDINFGILTCTLSTDAYCRQVAHNQPAVIVQNGTTRHEYSGDADKDQIVEFIHLLRDTADIELSETQALEILSGPRQQKWVVAFLPGAGALLHQLRLVARRLRPLKFVRVGVLVCGGSSGGLCANVRAPSARLYPATASPLHLSVSLEHLTEAPYILEWVLEHIDNSVLKLNWQGFTNAIIADDLNPNRNRKPWLVYFHSPRCYRCYEMYPDFAIVAIMLSESVQFGKVNCMKERSLCQHEQIISYPSIKLYLNRNSPSSVSRVVPFQPKEYNELIKDLKPHLRGYDQNLLADINFDIKSHIHFRDEL